MTSNFAINQLNCQWLYEDEKMSAYDVEISKLNSLKHWITALLMWIFVPNRWIFNYWCRLNGLFEVFRVFHYFDDYFGIQKEKGLPYHHRKPSQWMSTVDIVRKIRIIHDVRPVRGTWHAKCDTNSTLSDAQHRLRLKITNQNVSKCIIFPMKY